MIDMKSYGRIDEKAILKQVKEPLNDKKIT